MAQSFTTDALKNTLAYPFQDPKWKDKFLIGSLLTFAAYFLPIIPALPTYGYCAEIMRRIIVDKGEPYLPEWDDWNKLFGDGVKLFGVVFIYLLPLIVLFCAAYGAFFVPIFLGAMAEEGGAPEELPPLIGVLGPFGFMCMFGLLMILGLAIGMILPAAAGHVIATGDFAAGFRFSQIWTIFRANLAGFLISYVLLLGGWYALSFVMSILYLTIIFCCLYPFVLPPITFYTMIIASVLFGEAYRDGVEKVPEVEQVQPVS
jgi:hypothetical protein